MLGHVAQQPVAETAIRQVLAAENSTRARALEAIDLQG
jgi:hypothetical protein